MKIDILGSCVTRDALRFENPFILGRYYARTSLVSLYSQPLEIELNEINLPSDFLRRMVYYDLTKDFRKYMKWSDANVLVIDFIDERFNMLKFKDSYITHSNEFSKSMLNKELNATRINWNKKLLLWQQYAMEFTKEIKANYSLVVLHKAYWKDKYYDINGELKDYLNQPIKEKNEDLDYFYQVMESNFNEIKTIQLDDYIASANHIWGLTPYHYEDQYYKDFNKKLEEIIKSH